MPWDVARLHPNELQRLVKGAEIRNEKQERAMERGGGPSQEQRRREQEAFEKYT